MLNCKNISPTEDENKILGRLDPFYKKYNEMAQYEREFLNAVLLREKPKKVLELGVSAGGSSVLILNALKDGGRLYSVDYLKEWYKDTQKEVGWVVGNYPELKDKHTLFSGGLACDFIDEIGDGIDFAFIDTAHVFPGEVLDFLMVYPYLKPNAIVVFHDTGLTLCVAPYKKGNHNYCATAMLVSAITGEKYQPLGDYVFNENHPVHNITGIKLSPEIGQRLFEVFNLLVYIWQEHIEEKNLKKMIHHFSRFYPQEAVEYFQRVNDYQNNYFTRRWLAETVAGISVTKLNYHKYSILSKIIFGKLRGKYSEKRTAIEVLLKDKVSKSE